MRRVQVSPPMSTTPSVSELQADLTLMRADINKEIVERDLLLAQYGAAQSALESEIMKLQGDELVLCLRAHITLEP